MPLVAYLVADHSYDDDWIRNGLMAQGIQSCNLDRSNRRKKVDFGKNLYKCARNQNAFATPKD